MVQAMEALAIKVDHRHFNFDFPELKKLAVHGDLELKVVLEFLMANVESSIAPTKLVRASLTRGDSEMISWEREL